MKKVQRKIVVGGKEKSYKWSTFRIASHLLKDTAIITTKIVAQEGRIRYIDNRIVKYNYNKLRK